MLEANWEFIGHGWTQKALQSEPDETAVIDKCIERIQRFTGKKMRGWMGAGLSETMDTPDVLKSRGIEYTCDWVIDDLPNWMRTKHGPMVVARDPDSSNLMWLLDWRASPEMRMPHGRKKLSTCDRNDIRAWIREGALNN